MKHLCRAVIYGAVLGTALGLLGTYLVLMYGPDTLLNI